jgi:hypothetical protein
MAKKRMPTTENLVNLSPAPAAANEDREDMEWEKEIEKARFGSKEALNNPAGLFESKHFRIATIQSIMKLVDKLKKGKQVGVEELLIATEGELVDHCLSWHGIATLLNVFLPQKLAMMKVAERAGRSAKGKTFEELMVKSAELGIDLHALVDVGEMELDRRLDGKLTTMRKWAEIGKKFEQDSLDRRALAPSRENDPDLH